MFFAGGRGLGLGADGQAHVSGADGDEGNDNYAVEEG